MERPLFMGKRNCLFLVVVLALLLSQPGFASTLFSVPVQQFKKHSERRLEPANQSIQSVDRKADSSQLVNLNVNTVNALTTGDPLTLNLLPDKSYLAQVTEVSHTAVGIKHIHAEFTHNETRYPSLITLGQRAFSIQLNTPAGMYVVDGKGAEGTYQSVRPLSDEHIDDGVQLASAPSAGVPAVAESGTAMAEIDILLVYTRAAAALYDGDIVPKIENMVQSANQIFSNSGVYIRFNAAHTVEVEYDETATTVTALADLRHGSGAFAHIAALQHEVAADMVVLLKPTAPDDASSGRGYVNNLAGFYAPVMYSVTNIESGGAVLAHEIGHNLGLAHSRAQGNEGATFSFGVGYRLPIPQQRGFATIMAYSAENAPSVPYFSGPQLQCQGLPCGVSRTKSHGADAQYALNAVRFKVEDILTAGVQPTRIDVALNKIVDDNLKLCIQRASRNLLYTSQLSTLSCWDEQINSLGGLEQFTHLYYLDLDNNAVSDLTPISQLSRLTYLSLNGNDVTTLAPLQGMTSLSALFLNNNPLEDIASLSSLKQLTLLRLFATGITSLPDLSPLAHLQYIDAGANSLTTLASLQNNLNLQQLYAPGNRIGEYPKDNQWQKLRSLDLSYNQLSSVAAIRTSTSIQSLNLAHNRLFDVQEMSVLHRLQELTLSGNDLTSLIPLSSLNDLRFLEVSVNSLDSLAGIETLSKLEHLAAGNNGLHDVSAVARLDNLHHLAMPNNHITSVAAITGLSGLLHLDVRDNLIDDIGPLSDSVHLHSLWLDGNKLTDVSSLFKLYQLTSLTLTGNGLTPCWQVDYARWIVPDLPATACETHKDREDYDNDGVDNRSELTALRNPAYDEAQGDTIEFALPSALYAESDGVATVVLIRKGALAQPASVTMSSENGSALAESDYTAVSGSVEFTAGQMISHQMVTLLNDEHYEGEEEFRLIISDPANVAVGDEHTSTVRLSASDLQAGPAIGWASNWVEVAENQQRLTLSLVKPAEFNYPFSLFVEAADMTAQEGKDFQLPVTEIKFGADETVKLIEVEIVNNSQAQGDRMFVLNLYGASEIALNSEKSVMAVNIIEDDAESKGLVEFVNAELAVTEADGDVEVRLLRSNGNAGALTISIEIANESAAESHDYILPTTEITFSAGETTRAFTISIVNDDVDEATETLVLQLVSAEPGVIGEHNRLSIDISDSNALVVNIPGQTVSSAGGGGLSGLIIILLFALMGRYYRTIGAQCVYLYACSGRASQRLLPR